MVTDSNAMQHDSQDTSASLLDRAKARDPEAWKKVVAIYGPLVYHWARKSGLQANDASDVVQEVFLAVSKRLRQFERQEGKRFRGWVWTIASNKIRDHFRENKSNPVAQGGSTANLRLSQVPLDLPSEDSPEGQTELNLLRRQALMALRPIFQEQTWTAFWRTVVEGHSPNEVAADLGVSAWAVYKAKARVIQRLRVELEQLLDLKF